MTKVHAVIPAAGRGARFGSSVNKVLVNLAGRTIVQRTVDAVSPHVDTITVVVSQQDEPIVSELLSASGAKVVIGSDTRQRSVWNGLCSLPDEQAVVLVHDAARPFVSDQIIRRTIDSAIRYGSGVAAVPVVDALKRTETAEHSGIVVRNNVDRDHLWAVQTPQAFDLKLLMAAHRLAEDTGLSGLDEASLVQALDSASVHLVDGDRRNIKITTSSDLEFAEQLLLRRSIETRTGIGYDIHRLVPDRPLWLGGVRIQYELGLDGHSDADVLLHAVCDALLGAAGLPDIGHFFPNTDPSFLNISSMKLLAEVKQKLQDEGWRIGNVDSMLIAEKPKIASYIPEMKSLISSALMVSVDRVSIKATTNEGIGSLGACHGIACHATATVCR